MKEQSVSELKMSCVDINQPGELQLVFQCFPTLDRYLIKLTHGKEVASKSSSDSVVQVRCCHSSSEPAVSGFPHSGALSLVINSK